MHAGHDPLRVAGALDRGARLSPVLDLCGRCAGLYADLVALTAALPIAAMPVRRRGFTLTADDARRLRPARWRAWWAVVGSARDAFTRPLAIGFTTLGLAGLLLTAAPTVLVGMGGSSSSGAAAPEVDRMAVSPIPAAGGTPTLSAQPVDQPDGVPAAGTTTDPAATLALSLGLLGVGGGLFMARRVAVRRRPVR